MSDKTLDSIMKACITLLILVSGSQLVMFLITDTILMLTVISIAVIVAGMTFIIRKLWKDWEA